MATVARAVAPTPSPGEGTFEWFSKELEFSEAGYIEFDYNVSSAAGNYYDFLTVDWDQEEYWFPLELPAAGRGHLDIPAGTHTITFAFVQPWFQAAAGDAAWFTNIVAVSGETEIGSWDFGGEAVGAPITSWATSGNTGGFRGYDTGGGGGGGVNEGGPGGSGGVMAYGAVNWALRVWLGDAEEPSDVLVDGLLHKRASATLAASGDVAIVVERIPGEELKPDVLALLNHDFAGEADETVAVTVEAAENQAFTTGVVSVLGSRVLSGARHLKARCHAIMLPLDFTQPFFRVRLFWSGVGSRTVHLGEVWLGELTLLPRGLSLGTEETYRYFQSTATGANGERWVSSLSGPERSWQVKVDEAKASMAKALADMWRAGKGGVRPLLWLPRYKPAQVGGGNNLDCLLGRLREEVTVQDGVGAFTVSPLDIDSLLMEAK